MYWLDEWIHWKGFTFQWLFPEILVHQLSSLSTESFTVFGISSAFFPMYISGLSLTLFLSSVLCFWPRVWLRVGYVAEDDLELVIFLIPPPSLWHYRNMQGSWLSSIVFILETRSHCRARVVLTGPSFCLGLPKLGWQVRATMVGFLLSLAFRCPHPLDLRSQDPSALRSKQATPEPNCWYSASCCSPEHAHHQQ